MGWSRKTTRDSVPWAVALLSTFCPSFNKTCSGHSTSSWLVSYKPVIFISLWSPRRVASVMTTAWHFGHPLLPAFPVSSSSFSFLVQWENHCCLWAKQASGVLVTTAAEAPRPPGKTSNADVGINFQITKGPIFVLEGGNVANRCKKQRDWMLAWFCQQGKMPECFLCHWWRPMFVTALRLRMEI